MAATAGQIAEAGRIPGERIATTIVTSNSSTFTTVETQVASVSASLVSGRTYRVVFDGAIDSTASDDVIRTRIREDNTTGTTLQTRDSMPTISGATVQSIRAEAEYTATSTASKTFIATAVRQVSGGGTLNLAAAAGFPTYLYVDFIR